MRQSEAYREVMEIHDREAPDSRKRELAAIRERRVRLSWHIFWLTVGMALGTVVTFFTSGLWIHVSILATGIPAYAQEVTDFIKAL
jgi:hypothetical protein